MGTKFVLSVQKIILKKKLFKKEKNFLNMYVHACEFVFFDN